MGGGRFQSKPTVLVTFCATIILEFWMDNGGVLTKSKSCGHFFRNIWWIRKPKSAQKVQNKLNICKFAPKLPKFLDILINFSGLFQDFLRTFWVVGGLFWNFLIISSDFLKTFWWLSEAISGRGEEFLMTFWGLSVNNLRTFFWILWGLFVIFLSIFWRFAEAFHRTLSGLSLDFLRSL